jgi:hypothetical protein
VGVEEVVNNICGRRVVDVTSFHSRPEIRGGISMDLKSVAIGGLALLAVLVSSHDANAETDQEKAISAGATQLTSEEIADRIVGKTVMAKSGEKQFYFYYSEDNVLSGKLIGGDWSGTGYYGITDDDRVCLSMSKDKGRLRCLTLLLLDGAVKKYNVDGKMTFELLEFRDGNQL